MPVPISSTAGIFGFMNSSKSLKVDFLTKTEILFCHFEVDPCFESISLSHLFRSPDCVQKVFLRCRGPLTIYCVRSDFHRIWFIVAKHMHINYYFNISIFPKITKTIDKTTDLFCFVLVLVFFFLMFRNVRNIRYITFTTNIFVCIVFK